MQNGAKVAPVPRPGLCACRAQKPESNAAQKSTASPFQQAGCMFKAAAWFAKTPEGAGFAVLQTAAGAPRWPLSRHRP